MKVDAPVAETFLTNDEDGITITTATQTDEQLRANLGLAPPEPTAEEVAAQAAADQAARAAILDPDLDAQIDKVEPPAKDETLEQRTERRTRSQKKIIKEIALRKQAEDETARLRAENADLRSKVAPPPAGGDPKKAGAPNAAEQPATDVFKFPTFAEYQEQHPEAEWEEYSDARSDARYEWKGQQETAKAAATQQDSASRATYDAIGAAVEAFKSEYGDYERMVDSFVTPKEADGKTPTQQVVYLSKLVAQEAPERVGPTLYWLANHPKVATALMEAKDLGAMLKGFGAVQAHVDTWLEAETAKKASGAPAAKAVTTKPVPKAPVPLKEVKGQAEHTRTAAEIAEDDEDADAYIAKRTAEQRAAG